MTGSKASPILLNGQGYRVTAIARGSEVARPGADPEAFSTLAP